MHPRNRTGPWMVEGCFSAFDEPDIAGARTFLGFLGREFYALTFTQQFEHRTSH